MCSGFPVNQESIYHKQNEGRAFRKVIPEPGLVFLQLELRSYWVDGEFAAVVGAALGAFVEP